MCVFVLRSAEGSVGDEEACERDGKRARGHQRVLQGQRTSTTSVSVVTQGHQRVAVQDGDAGNPQDESLCAR